MAGHQSDSADEEVDFGEAESDLTWAQRRRRAATWWIAGTAMGWAVAAAAGIWLMKGVAGGGDGVVAAGAIGLFVAPGMVAVLALRGVLPGTGGGERRPGRGWEEPDEEEDDEGWEDGDEEWRGD